MVKQRAPRTLNLTCEYGPDGPHPFTATTTGRAPTCCPDPEHQRKRDQVRQQRYKDRLADGAVNTRTSAAARTSSAPITDALNAGTVAPHLRILTSKQQPTALPAAKLAAAGGADLIRLMDGHRRQLTGPGHLVALTKAALRGLKEVWTEPEAVRSTLMDVAACALVMAERIPTRAAA